MAGGRPRLLDAFCSAGGASMGYHLAGFDVYGVDARPQPRYPFPFHQADAFEFVKQHGHEFDVIAGSPECRDHTRLTASVGLRGTGWQLEEFRELCEASGRPWVIENVESAAALAGGLLLCGSAFGLGAVCRDGRWRELRRHRLFASNVWLWGTSGCVHSGEALSVFGTGGNRRDRTRVTGGQSYRATLPERSAALGIDWMTVRELSQAIPPAYTKFIGEQLLGAL